jgi:AraC-like DNA-binding protein
MSGRWTQYGVQALEAVGVDMEAMCRKAGLSYQAVSDPAAWIDHERFASLWSHAVRTAGDPNLGLHAAERFQPVARDLLIHLLMSCKTLGEGVLRATSFFELAGDRIGATFVPRPTEKIFLLASRSSEHTAWVEFRLASYWRFAEMAAQRELSPVEVRFRHPDRGAPRELYERVYRCPVKFSSIENCLVVSDEVLTTPLPYASEETARALEKAASLTALGPESSDVEGQVRLLIRTNMPDGDHSESAIARAMHMSERTLKRRLAESGCNFSDLVDDVRQRLALDLILTTPATLEEVARQVGYAGAGSLVRAVKRWTGHTPSTLRHAKVGKRSA